MHSTLFHVFTHESEEISEAEGSVLRYTISTDRCDEEWYCKRNELSGPDEGSGETFSLFAAAHWAAPASVAFVADTSIYSSADALTMVLHYQTLLCTPLASALASLSGVSAHELKQQPPREICSRMSVIAATITALSNIMSFPNGVCVGYHNCSQVIGAETERRELAWQDLRKSIKQTFIRTKAAHDEHLRELFERIGDVDEAELRRDAEKRELKEEIERLLLEEPDEPAYGELEAMLHSDSLPIALIQAHHTDTIHVVEGLARGLRLCVHKMCAQNIDDTERARDDAGGIAAPRWSTGHKVGQNVDDENAVWLQLVLWIESMMVSLDLMGTSL